MITVKRLKDLLDKIPDYASLHAYEGEKTGITIYDVDDHYWFIEANSGDEVDECIEGFD